MRHTKAYFGAKISPNMRRHPSGYLICENVPIARTGWQTYLPSEIGAQGTEPLDVWRDESEVFSPDTMKSFEGVPVCNNHPPEGVDPHNSDFYVEGAVSHVRRGVGDMSDFLLADLIVYDERLIRDIENGKREVSCGYECDYVPNDDGTYSQANILGNHVAVVDAGRAGDKVRINDSRVHREEVTRDLRVPEVKVFDRDIWIDGKVCTADAKCDEHKNSDGTFKGGFDGAVAYFKCKGYSEEAAKKIAGKIAAEKGADAAPAKTKARDSLMGLKNALRKPLSASKLLMAEGWRNFVNDSDAEEIATAMDSLREEEETKDGNDFPVPTTQENKGMDKAKDAEPATEGDDALEKKVDRLTELVEKLLSGKADDEDPEKALDAEIEKLQQTEDPEHEKPGDEEEGEPTTDEEGPVAPPEDRVRNAFTAQDSAAKIAYLREMKKAIAKLPDAGSRKLMSDAALKAVRGTAPRSTGAYAKIGTQPKKRPAQDNKPVAIDTEELIRNMDAKWNPHNPEFKKNNR